MATKKIPVIEPWHRSTWSELEAIAMLNLKGQPNEWARIRALADILPGYNFNGDQLMRIQNKLKLDREQVRRASGIRI